MKPVKTLLAICGGLMTIASVMGTIDYARANKSGELKNLYKEGPEPLAAIPFFNNEQLRAPDPPSLRSFSRGPIRQYNEAEYQAELKAANEENDKLYKHRRAVAKRAAGVINRKKLRPPIDLSSFRRAPLPEHMLDESKK